MSSLDHAQAQIETVKKCNNAITIITGLLIEFQIDSEGEDKIPKDIKKNYIKSGLLNAIEIASDASENAAEWLEEWLENEHERRGAK